MRYLRPDESLLYAPVSGSIDADYDADWLTNGRPGFPARYTGTAAWTVTPGASQDVDVICLHHHNVREAAVVTLGGSFTNTIPTSAPQPDGTFPNIYRRLNAPVATSSLVLGISGNTDPVTTSLYAGLSRTLGAPLRLGRRQRKSQPYQWEGESMLQAPYDHGVADPRTISGDCVLTETQLADVDAWYQSTRRGSRPTLIIPDDAINDAMLATFTYDAVDFAPGDYPAGSPVTEPQALFQVSFEFLEIPRVRW